MRRVLASLEPCWLGGATGQFGEPVRVAQRPVPLHSGTADLGVDLLTETEIERWTHDRQVLGLGVLEKRAQRRKLGEGGGARREPYPANSAALGTDQRTAATASFTPAVRLVP